MYQQPPQQMDPGAPARPEPPVRPGIIKERNPIVVIILSMVTCGVYWFYWMYKITEELRDATGDETLKPGTDLLLGLVTCGMWGLYTEYRHVQKVHQAILPMDPGHKDQGQTVMILNIVTVAGAWLGGMTGICAIIAQYMVQDEHNKLANMYG